MTTRTKVRTMSKVASAAPPPDRRERIRALDTSRSILVEAPAGSGKTDLLTRRFLRLLGEVDDPSHVVAITFTIAAAAEMRHRILGELEKAASAEASDLASDPGSDDLSTASLARRAFQRSGQRGWDLPGTPAVLRIATIDSFCRDLALQRPLLSELGGGIEIYEQPKELYRRAAQKTLEEIGGGNTDLSAAIAQLLDWRDNNWHELEEQLVGMLEKRDQWMHDFLLNREPDWAALRERLERPLANAVRDALTAIDGLLDQVPGAREEALALARFASDQSEGRLHRELAGLAGPPSAPFPSAGLEEARQAYLNLANLLLTDGSFRRQVDKRHGFPADRRAEKNRMLALLVALGAVPGLEAALGALCKLPSARYTDDEWQIVRACFVVLRHAAGQLRVVFAESGAADFVEVAQGALSVLRGEDGFPSEAAQSVADGIRHLLVDEFQDTSRRQHKLLEDLVAAWPGREGRTVFAVGDPMQSIYSFRDADAELFSRVRNLGLEIRSDEPLRLEFVSLRANFRTIPSLVDDLNRRFAKIFAIPDGSGIPYSPALPQRDPGPDKGSRLTLHLEFMEQSARGGGVSSGPSNSTEEAADRQLKKIVGLIRLFLPRIEEARQRREKLRVAVLGRTRRSLQWIAAALRNASIPFRALDLEGLAERPEVMDAIALARALLNPEDRVAWLGVLRAPWCGLALEDLHKLVSDDDDSLLRRTVPELLAERISLLAAESRPAAQRLLDAMGPAGNLAKALPNQSPGTWLQQVWLRLGAAGCVDSAGRANLDLLWRCLDQLPNGVRDILSPALPAALDRLTALPDPSTSSECGVQLMTIHKAKGLEFEVVIVPDLHADSGRSRSELLSWLERGVAPSRNPEPDDEPTEFLIAPMPSKGNESGTTKRWVDRVRHDREAQEDRRILYVASTRAREELHLFARPSYKVETNGSFTLCEPTSLLKTAWPALEDDVRARFAAWTAERWKRPVQGMLFQIAAAAQSDEADASAHSTLLRRLPAGYAAEQECLAIQASAPAGAAASESDGEELYERHEGGILSRALGRAVHSFLEELAGLRRSRELEPARADLRQLAPRIAAELRAAGLDPAQSSTLAAEALDIALRASRDPVCEWILSPHDGAASEARWVGVIDGNLRTVRIDRVFRAGDAPRKNGDSTWWIVDFKTHPPESRSDPAAGLPSLRKLFAPQLETYAVVLRNLHGKDALVRAGLYYPRMLLFDAWDL